MPRDYKVYFEDISQACAKISEYMKGVTLEMLKEDSKTFDAVVRNLEIIGEAVKKVPEEIRNEHSEIEWKRIAGLRDVLIHKYSSVDPDIVWDVIANKLPSLKKSVDEALL